MKPSWRKSILFLTLNFATFGVLLFAGTSFWLAELISFPFLILAIWTKPLSKYSRLLMQDYENRKRFGPIK